MKKQAVYIFIDALGWEIARRHNFMLCELPFRYRVKMQLGYSCAAIPTILSGQPPEKHGHFSFFYYDPENSPFKKFKYIKYFFGAGLGKNSLLNRGRIRRAISKITARILGYGGYFSLYGVPFEKLPLFGYCEKSDIFAVGGLKPVENLRDVCIRSKAKFHISDWRKSEAENFEQAKRAIRGGAEFVFIYTGDFDAFMHQNVGDEKAVGAKLASYKERILGLMKTLEEQNSGFELSVISDHGMTPTKETCDIMDKVERLGLKFGEDYAAFFDSTMARFWYPTNSGGARVKIRGALKEFKGNFLSEDEKRVYGIRFENSKFGEDIFLMQSGVQIEPCDLSAKAPKGMHGYSPEDADSYACMLSTAEAKFAPAHVGDFFRLMVSNLEYENGKIK